MVIEQRTYPTLTGTTTEWSSVNPVLAKGQVGYDSVAKVYRVGDGTTAWGSLPTIASGGTKVSALTTATTPLANADVTNLVQGGVSKKTTIGDIRRFIPFEILNFAAAGNTPVAGIASAAVNSEMWSTSKVTRTKLDLALATQFRLTAVVTALGNATGAAIKGSYMTTNAATWTNIDLAATTTNLVVGTGTAGTVFDTGWVNIATGAKLDNVFVAVTVAVAFGTTAPSFGSIQTYFR